jgi:hypothetical protein
MDPQTAFKLVEELRLQSRLAQFAWLNLRTSLQGLDGEKTFFFVQALLDHAMFTAGLLWPRRPASQDRGAWLRQALRVPDDSPLRLRGIREQLERPDEQFEDWLASLDNKNYVDMNIMPQTALGEVKLDTFQRSLDPDTYKLVLRGATCDLRHVVDVLKQLDVAAVAWQRTNKPW